MIPFNSKCFSVKYENWRQFNLEIDKIEGSGSSSFEPLFKKIENLVQNTESTDLTVILMTDGSSKKSSTLESFNSLIQTTKDLKKSIWFYCFGFSDFHNIWLLNEITQKGT